MDTTGTSAKHKDFFGPHGNSLHFESPDDCHPDNEMLKLQHKPKRMNTREFERWIVQLYLRRAFTISSQYFSLPFIIEKIPEERAKCPDFECRESGLQYGLEVTKCATTDDQKQLVKSIADRAEHQPIGEAWLSAPRKKWAEHTATAITKKTKKLRDNYSKNGFSVCDLILYSYLPAPFFYEDLNPAHRTLIEIIKNNSDVQEESKLRFRRVSIICEGWAILDIFEETPRFLPHALGTL